MPELAAVPSLRRLCASAVLVALFAALLDGSARAEEVFAKPPLPGGGVNSSSWVFPDGTDWDTYAWDEFTLAETQTITEVRWRGGYQYGAPQGKVNDFKVSFFDSNASGFEPLITALPEKEDQETVIATFHTNSNAGETFVGSSGGVLMYDYQFTLPTPVTIPGGVKCWFRVVGVQPVKPDWGMATGTGGNGSHFKFSTGTSMFQNWPHDLAFSLHAEWADLGQALAGTHGKPHLTGGGTLETGAPFSVQLSGALEGSLVYAIVGVAQIDLPFQGGTLVPAASPPLGVIRLFVADASGKLDLAGTWPGGLPPGTEVFIQDWILDPGAPFGFAASNAIKTLVH